MESGYRVLARRIRDWVANPSRHGFQRALFVFPPSGLFFGERGQQPLAPSPFSDPSTLIFLVLGLALVGFGCRNTFRKD